MSFIHNKFVNFPNKISLIHKKLAPKTKSCVEIARENCLVGNFRRESHQNDHFRPHHQQKNKIILFIFNFVSDFYGYLPKS